MFHVSELKSHTQNSANGVALDGYLYLATAFIDFDGDGIQDGDEPSGSTDADGNFSISSIKTYPILELLLRVLKMLRLIKIT